jgi:hypothetical protein
MERVRPAVRQGAADVKQWAGTMRQRAADAKAPTREAVDRLVARRR